MDIQVKSSYRETWYVVNAVNVDFALFPEKHYNYWSDKCQTVYDLLMAGF
jgi:hypothetical protein